MIAVGSMNYDVCLGSFSGQEIRAVQVAVDEPDFGVLRCNLRAFVAVADQCGDFEIRVCVCNCIQGVSANIAGCTSAVDVLDAGRGRLQSHNLHE